jgi:hypothetical protein
MGLQYSKKKTSEQNITDEIVEKYVRLIVENKKINQEMLPDYFEKKIYRAVFHILFYELSQSLPKSEFILFDHKITLQVTPVKTDSSEQIEQMVVETHDTIIEKNQCL